MTITRGEELRTAICAGARSLYAAGLAPGKSGNVSARLGDGLLITPSGVPYPAMQPEDIVELDGAGSVRAGRYRPSTELPLHQAIYAAHPTVQAIVHTHSPHATALSCARRSLPAFHYMIAVAGGSEVRCADYATFGSEQLAAYALGALEDRKAVLLANHGVVGVGEDLEEALNIAVEIENLARQYLLLLAAHLEPIVLDTAEMQRVHAQFADYGYTR
ncbi:L-fuculose-phosphate aldolase [Steroidobacter denitrificans]|uniref:L-fuculose-phosphate aldolase n=1 Tax=Steroidobacter denitrificans TaxID=465721 RepID=A0A127F9T3_STEDE|nr:class II aldolase/adducin family protein [Steroidobacter denitrificans]AMN47173.1 L-fuculose-phosphate aldolase [Steroidobacter denitrificans]